MKAVILAAGAGARLNRTLGDDPKCLVKIGGLTLVERQIRELNRMGIRDILVVAGFGADHVRAECGSAIQFVENARHAQTNSLYSLWLTRDLLGDGFVVLNADVLFHPQLLSDLLMSRYEDALLVSYVDEPALLFGEEEMKVRVRRGQVVDISKTMEPAEADGENVGIAKFGPAGARLLVGEMDALIKLGGEREWATCAFKEFAARRPLHAIGTRGLPWIEIDFPEDYRRAVIEVLPQIEAAATRIPDVLPTDP